ncbi:SRPBCC family protein [Prauserella cavernicola]|uniref:SRPBCC family protein n=1 Tax=Prauserella cavernicola TaxID=2800127 RepID=A0A934QZB1_9PSEU|nr:SRPBCC family protein [Prauserella cavernicola]MBK1788033.1 SRPBCC family protein [Prauserella cavernicola]
MSAPPTGRLIRTERGYDLLLTRALKDPLAEVWASVTEPERTARWFGPWEGEGGAGTTVRVHLTAEDGEPPAEVRIDACDAPHHLAVTMSDESGGWRLELHLTEHEGTTALQFTHHLDSLDGLGEIGPGWEFYLDRLVAAVDDTPLPGFDEYYPAQKAYYEAEPGL